MSISKGSLSWGKISAALLLLTTGFVVGKFTSPLFFVLMMIIAGGLIGKFSVKPLDTSFSAWWVAYGWIIGVPVSVSTQVVGIWLTVIVITSGMAVYIVHKFWPPKAPQSIESTTA